MKNKYIKNIAFIDGQNLHIGTLQNRWKVDFSKFRIFLRDQYCVGTAYYFLGYLSDISQEIGKNLQRFGYIVVYKQHGFYMKTTKKGNVDTDIVFEIMKNLIDNQNFDKIVVVSNDGDYKKVIDYLITKEKFEKILFPNKNHVSSLYKILGNQFFASLDDKDTKRKIIK
jgi:uncharacterized LabA/DUF88 family protein